MAAVTFMLLEGLRLQFLAFLSRKPRSVVCIKKNYSCYQVNSRLLSWKCWLLYKWSQYTNGAAVAVHSTVFNHRVLSAHLTFALLFSD